MFCPISSPSSHVARSPNSGDCGDYADWYGNIQIYEQAESPLQYWEGRFYPVRIGDIISDRYRIEHKLGSGGYATVWMARDTLNDADVALKIIAHGQAGVDELSIQNQIIASIGNRDTPLLLLYQSAFLLESPFGQHQVLVFPVKGPSIKAHYKETSYSARLSALKQLLQSLECLHDAGFVHSGLSTHAPQPADLSHGPTVNDSLPDINSGNVLYGLDSFNDCKTPTERYERLGRPVKKDVPDGDEPMWKRGELVKPMKPPSNMVRNTTCLGDFGLTIKDGTPVEDPTLAYMRYCSPERWHGMMPSFASDMWSYYCLFAELYLGGPVISGMSPSNLIRCIVSYFGPVPESWKGSFLGRGRDRAMDAWYDPRTQVEHRLEDIITEYRPDITAREGYLVLRILRRGFVYIPEHRLTASQLLRDSSFIQLLNMYGVEV